MDDGEVVRCAGGEALDELGERGTAVAEAARGVVPTHQDAPRGVGHGVARVDADACEAGHAEELGQRALEAWRVAEQDGVGTRGDGGLSDHLLLKCDGGGRELSVNRFERVAKGGAVDGEGAHGVTVGAHGALKCEEHEGRD